MGIDDRAEALWIWALDRERFAAASALLGIGFHARPFLASYDDLRPAGREIYDRLAALDAELKGLAA